MKYQNRLEELRKKYNLSQKQIADELKITQQAYSNYENGKREADYETLSKLAAYFNTSTDFILGIANKDATQDNKEQPPPSEMETVEWFRQGLVKYGVVKDGESLTDTQLKILLNNVEFLAEQLKNGNE